MNNTTNSLYRYQKLIQELPTQEQSFTIKASNWQKQLSAEDFRTLFREESTTRLSRKEVHDTNDSKIFLLKVILWGYPQGMRGNHFMKIYGRLEELSEIFNNPNRAKLQFEDLRLIQQQIKDIEGIGLSTYSKFLYFRDYQFDDVTSLIMDERIIRVIKGNLFQELEILRPLNSYNAEKKYIEYLKLMKQLSEKLNTYPENLEQFLFLFGNNLKPNKL